MFFMNMRTKIINSGEDIMGFIDWQDQIALVEIPDGTLFKRANYGYKAAEVIINKVEDMSSIETLEWLKSLGVKPHTTKVACFHTRFSEAWTH